MIQNLNKLQYNLNTNQNRKSTNDLCIG